MKTSVLAVEPPEGGVLTAAYLSRIDACDAQTRRFLDLYPDGLRVTRRNLLALAGQDFDLTWAARRVLDADALAAFHERWRAAGEDCERACRGARRAFEAGTVSAECYVESARKAHGAMAVAKAAGLCDILGLDEQGET